MYTMHYPFGLWLPVLVLALLALLLAGTAALAFMAFAVTGEALTTQERLVARMGRPLVLLGVLDACLLLVGCGLLAVAFWTPDGLTVPWRGPFIGLAFMLLHGAIMGAVVMAVWKRIASAARRRVVLFCLGIIWLVAVLCGALLTVFPLARLGSLAGLASLSGLSGVTADAAAMRALFLHLVQNLTPFALASALLSLCGLGLTGAGLLGTLWLLARRGRDDFGRDYYVHTLRFCASKAAAGCTLLFAGYVFGLPSLLERLANQPDLPAALPRLLQESTGWGPWLVVRIGADPLSWIGNIPTLHPLLPMFLLLFLLPALAGLLFRRVSTAQVPLRHKLALVTGLVCVLAAVWGDIFLLCLMM